MYCSNRCFRSTPKRCHSICLQLRLLFHCEVVEFLRQSRRREPLLSGRVQHYLWGEDSNGNPFEFSKEPPRSGFPGRSYVHVNGGNDA